MLLDSSGGGRLKRCKVQPKVDTIDPGSSLQIRKFVLGQDATDHDDNVALLIGVEKRLSSKSRALRAVSDSHTFALMRKSHPSPDRLLNPDTVHCKF